MSSLYTNIDGLTQAYGNVRASGREGYTRKLNTYGSLNELIVDFDFSTLEVYDEGEPQSSTMDRFSELQAYVPAGAGVLMAYILPYVDFDESIDVGLYEKDGTAIDDDGLFEDVTPELAGGIIEGNGDEIGEIMPEDAYIVIAPENGAPNTGRARLVVWFVR